MSVDQIKTAALEQHVDALNEFALKCRAELHKVLRLRDLGKAVGCFLWLRLVYEMAATDLSRSMSASPSIGLRKNPIAPRSK